LKTIKFSASSTAVYFDSSIKKLKRITDAGNTFLLTDENVYHAHADKFKDYKTIIIAAGEQNKIQITADTIIGKLIAYKANRQSTLIGIGGGVVSDLAGYVASIYMRGINFGFVPTTVLGLVDASIGGKNGIDVGPYKNMVGTIRQPSFILHDSSLLQSLPRKEWRNGFAEIIKHACIKDARMFAQLQKHKLDDFINDRKLMTELIQRNTLLKIRIVRKDEFEKKERMLLNFGHTIAHAIENLYNLMHGEAVSLGMVMAAMISEKLTEFKHIEKLRQLLLRYELPVKIEVDTDKVFEMLKMDKKHGKDDQLNFIFLEKIGQAVVQPVSLKLLEKMIAEIQL